MYDHTSGATRQKWLTQIQGYLGNLQRVFFDEKYGGRTLVEYACEPLKNCNKDQRSFKAYLARWLGVTMQLVPETRGTIQPWIEGSTDAVAKACSDTPQGLACGRTWYDNRDDGERDVGNQMTAMSMVQTNFILKGAAPLADINTGNSASDPSAGSNGKTLVQDKIYTRKITAGDKAGAWILTVICIVMTIVGMFALLVEGDDLKEYSAFRRFSWRD